MFGNCFLRIMPFVRQCSKFGIEGHTTACSFYVGQLRLHTHTHKHPHTQTPTHTHKYTHIHTPNTHTYYQTHTHAHTHTYIHTHTTHTWTHTYTALVYLAKCNQLWKWYPDDRKPTAAEITWYMSRWCVPANIRVRSSSAIQRRLFCLHIYSTIVKMKDVFERKS